MGATKQQPMTSRRGGIIKAGFFLAFVIAAIYIVRSTTAKGASYEGVTGQREERSKCSLSRGPGESPLHKNEP